MKTLDWLTLLAALGTALASGFFFAFSICVMQALGKIPAPQGIAAMQSINIVVINPWFMTVFMGAALLGVVLIIAAFSRWHDPRAVYWLAGGALYVIGTFVVTMLFNVPRNNALAALPPDSPAAARLWVDYLSSWTAWNHVRTIASLLATAAFTLAFRLRA